MLKATKTEETIGFFVTFLPLVAFQFGGGWAPSLATPMPYHNNCAHGLDSRNRIQVLCKLSVFANKYILQSFFRR